MEENASKTYCRYRNNKDTLCYIITVVDNLYFYLQYCLTEGIEFNIMLEFFIVSMIMYRENELSLPELVYLS